MRSQLKESARKMAATLDHIRHMTVADGETQPYEALALATAAELLRTASRHALATAVTKAKEEVGLKAKLNSEINTAEMEQRIGQAAIKQLLIPANNLHTFFEHGHWWVGNYDTGEQWSVTDASGPGSTDGFDFELVTTGEEN